MDREHDRLRDGVDDLTVWFREVVAAVLEHLVRHGHGPSDLLDPESDVLDETAAIVAWDWWTENQEPHEYGHDGGIEATVDRAEQKALTLLAIVRGAPPMV